MNLHINDTIHTGSDFCGNCEHCKSTSGIYTCGKTGEVLDPDWSSCNNFESPRRDDKIEMLTDTNSQIDFLMRHLITLEKRVEILETREKEMTESLDSLDDDYEECHGELCEAEAWIDTLKHFVDRTESRFYNLEAKVFKGYDIRTDAEVCQMCDRKDDPDYCNPSCTLFPF